MSDLTIPLVSGVNPYHRRRPLELIVQRCKTELCRNSFLPSASMLWNSLPFFVQEYHSIGQLKHYLSSLDTLIPSYYYRGKRREQVLHCKLRLGISDLNYDLCRRHLSCNPACSCQNPQETAEHFLIHCPNYQLHRAQTISHVPADQISIKNLLFGNSDLSVAENEVIFNAVQSFIRLSGRFGNVN